MLESILSTSSSITLQQFVYCTAVSLILGLVCAGIYMFRNSYNKSFVVTLALMPAIVQMVIMLVNGNIGTGLAVAGTFGLVRYRSLPGSAREIGSIFLAVAVGLATGSGYLGIAALFVAVMGCVSMALVATRFGEMKKQENDLYIQLPENLDYSGRFDGVLEKYTQSAKLLGVRTMQMGSLFELHYRVTMNHEVPEKAFVDDLRALNGNLSIKMLQSGTREDQL